jgi:predicted RNA methylase
MQAIWSNSDFPYMCLRDRKRTEAFRAAIGEVVKPGDHVIEIGAGSGILSMFACTAGAARVTAVEVDPVLSRLVAASARENGLDDRLTVITGDGRDLDLPRADVVIAELIDTGLLDEQQLPVMNALIERGVITSATRVIPSGYQTQFQLVTVDEQMYGYTIKALRHEWPFYHRDDNWTNVSIQEASAPIVVWEGIFNAGPHPTQVRRRLHFTSPGEATVNGLRISGVATLSPTLKIGACDSLNGDKIVPLPERRITGYADLDVAFEMGSGLGSLTAHWCR